MNMAKLEELGAITRLADELRHTGWMLANAMAAADSNGRWQITVGEKVISPDPRAGVRLLEEHARTLMDQLRDLGIKLPSWGVWLDAAVADYYA
jgi:hypothetical protein